MMIEEKKEKDNADALQQSLDLIYQICVFSQWCASVLRWSRGMIPASGAGGPGFGKCSQCPTNLIESSLPHDLY